MSEREKKLEEALSQFIKPIKGIPFEVVIKALWDVSVEKFDLSQEKNADILEKIVKAFTNLCKDIQQSPIQNLRINEVGNAIEPFVVKHLKVVGINAESPKTKSGMGKSAGYPDVKITGRVKPIYIEVKTYSSTKPRDTSFRSFYLSPSDNPKVIEDAHHILVGFSIEKNGDKYIPIAFEIVDLYGLDCDMKSEFNSDNKRLYEASRSLAKKNVPVS